MIYRGYIYSTLADVPVDANLKSCQTTEWGGPGYLPLPLGFSIASATAETIKVTAAHYWSADAVIFFNGDVYSTKRGPTYGYTPGSYYYSGALRQSGSTYNVDGCSRQILISSKKCIMIDDTA